MKRLLVIALVVSTAAFGQRKKATEDAPIPYDENSDDDDKRRDLPKRSPEAPERREETQVEQEDREVTLAGEDDPNIGLSLEIVASLFLLESSRGGVEPLAMGGIRFTWEWARTLLADEFWREVFFADVTWFATSAWGPSGFGGTKDVYDSVNYHFFTIAQGFAFPLGKTPFAVYVEPGIGLNYQTSSIYVQGMQTDVSAIRLVAQYGIGIRARILLSSAEEIRKTGYKADSAITFRAELTRFRRGYMDDTLLGVSAGITF